MKTICYKIKGKSFKILKNKLHPENNVLYKIVFKENLNLTNFNHNLSSLFCTKECRTSC